MHLLLPCSSFSSVKRKCDHVKYDFLQDPHGDYSLKVKIKPSEL